MSDENDDLQYLKAFVDFLELLDRLSRITSTRPRGPFGTFCGEHFPLMGSMSDLTGYGFSNSKSYEQIPIKLKMGISESGKPYLNMIGSVPKQYKPAMYDICENQIRQMIPPMLKQYENDFLNLLRKELDVLSPLEKAIKSELEETVIKPFVEVLLSAGSVKEANSFRVIADVPGVTETDENSLTIKGSTLSLRISGKGRPYRKIIDLRTVFDNEGNSLELDEFDLENYKQTLKNGVLERVYFRKK